MPLFRWLCISEIFPKSFRKVSGGPRQGLPKNFRMVSEQSEQLPKGVRMVSDGFPKCFRILPKNFQTVSEQFSKDSEGFPQEFCKDSKGFLRLPKSFPEDC